MVAIDTAHVRGDSDAANHSRELVFGPVATENAAIAVVRRLRAAIALGFLDDGDRLPREADLVRQLGVTAFALREALGILRDEGLITTRRGQRGGSFVSHSSGRISLMSGELRRMTTTGLRDLGDWRQMLASRSALLAAKRASDANVRRLGEYARAIGEADTAAQAWRAHGRFHLELAAAAQSIRMTRAEFGMYEEFNWLLELALADRESRERSSEELAEVAAAVAAREPERARDAAARHSASTVQRLVELRLDSIAKDSDRRRIGMDGAVDELVTMFSAVEIALDRLADAAEAVLARDPSEAELRARLGKVVAAALRESGLDIDGMACIAEPGAIRDHHYWMAWWHVENGKLVDDRSVVLDPQRADFYDYTQHDFFRVPRETGELRVQGPFVDYGAANDYIITFARPIYRAGEFAGVVTADLPVAAIEERLAPWLAVGDDTRIVMNAYRRVIAGNSAEYVVGDVLPEGGYEELELPPPSGWHVVSG